MSVEMTPSIERSCEKTRAMRASVNCLNASRNRLTLSNTGGCACGELNVVQT